MVSSQSRRRTWIRQRDMPTKTKRATTTSASKSMISATTIIIIVSTALAMISCRRLSSAEHFAQALLSTTTPQHGNTKKAIKIKMNRNDNYNVPSDSCHAAGDIDGRRRRKILSSAPMSLMLLLLQSSASMIMNPRPVNAARGAAELDLEFYARSLVSKNKKEGQILPSAPPPVPPARKLQEPLLPLLLNNDCDPSCIPVQAMIQEILKQNPSSSPTDIANKIQRRVNEIRESTRRSFAAKAQWQVEDVSDQYYFDFTSYALWKTAGEFIPNPVDRDRFVRSMGQMIFEKIMPSLQSSKLPGKRTLVDSTRTIIGILQLFQTSGFCKGYRIRTSDFDGVDDDQSQGNSSTKNNNDVPQSSISVVVFDDFDDESLDSGGTVDCLVSIYEPATLGASLQINGEQSRFGPDLIGPTLAAAWDVTAKVKSSWEIFFVDPQYRPNPKDYFPNEKLVQYTLSRK